MDDKVDRPNQWAHCGENEGDPKSEGCVPEVRKSTIAISGSGEETRGQCQPDAEADSRLRPESKIGIIIPGQADRLRVREQETQERCFLCDPGARPAGQTDQQQNCRNLDCPAK